MAPSHIEKLNRSFAKVDVGSGTRDTVVVELDPETGLLVGTWSFEAFRRKLSGSPPAKVGNREWMPLADAWLRHPQARHYAGVVYAPPASPLLGANALPPPRTYNTWAGFAVVPAFGDWKGIEDFLYDIICAGSDELFGWLLNWMAALVQRPGQHALTALVLKGGQGIGKSFFAERILGAMFRRHDWVQLTDPNRLVQQFNAVIANKVLVFADEAVWDDKRIANKLKGLITSDVIQIEQKYRPVEDVPSTIHLVIASNSHHPVDVERDDRRLAIFQVSEARRQDTAYFGSLQRALDEGASSAMLYDFQGYPIDDALLRTPPDNAAKQEMKAASLNVEDAWWGDVLADADPSTWERAHGRQTLFRQLQDYAKQQRRAPRVQSNQQLGNFFATHFHHGGMDGWPKGGRDLKVQDGATGKRVNAWLFPELEDCRHAFKKATGVRGDW